MINPDTQSSTFSLAFRYRTTTAPNLNSVTPGSGTILGNRVLTLAGTNFAPGATVDFGGVPAAATTVNSTISITATTPAGSSVGPLPVTVTNPNGEPSLQTPPRTYTYSLVSITSISPSVDGIAGGTSFTLTGQDIAPGSSLFFDTTIAVNINVVDSTLLTG